MMDTHAERLGLLERSLDHGICRFGAQQNGDMLRLPVFLAQNGRHENVQHIRAVSQYLKPVARSSGV
jgi:hypothetical protein